MRRAFRKEAFFVNEMASAAGLAQRNPWYNII